MRKRTVIEEAVDAQRQLADAARAIEDARKHIRRLRGNPSNPGIAYQARRSAQIAKGSIDEAYVHLGEAVHLSELAADAEQIAAI